MNCSNTSNTVERAGKAPWHLVAITMDLKGEKEPIALVETSEGERAVPLSEAKEKVDLYGQLPESKKKQLAEHIWRKCIEWKEKGVNEESSGDAKEL